MLTPANKQLEYTIRVSPRARHVRLKVNATDGLCVIVPRGFDESEVMGLLAEKRGWIEKALLKVGPAPEPLAADYRPRELPLPACGEHWQIHYEQHGQKMRLRENPAGQQLTLLNVNHDQDQVFALLRGWLRRKARQQVVPQTEALAAELGMKIGKVTIRNQRSRWGSCSSKKNLSLNLKLLFVSPEQLRYVLVHELCHTVHLNHSPAFWKLVERFEPESAALKRTMPRAWWDVPVWV